MSPLRAHGRARSVRLLATLVIVGVALGACAREEGEGEEVRAFLDATSVEAHRFIYTETTPSGVETVVQGIIEDDFRYKARMVVNDKPVLDRVVHDDAAAVRFLEPEVLGKYLDKKVVSEVDTETDREGIDVFAALQSKRWVLDPAGAPPLLRSAEAENDNGVDPIFDALELIGRARDLSFVRNAFVEYNPNSISPTYRSDEDPFPRPEEGSDVVRYDVPQIPFPKTVDAGQVVLPAEGNFRKFSLYVKDGKVIRVAESIGLSPTVLEDFESYMVQLITETTPPEVSEGFRSTLAGLDGQEKGQFLLDSVNTFRELRGDPLLRFRTAVYELLDIGDPTLMVELPAEETIRGDLAVLVNLGVKPFVEETDDGPAIDAATIEAIPGGAGGSDGSDGPPPSGGVPESTP